MYVNILKSRVVVHYVSDLEVKIRTIYLCNDCTYGPFGKQRFISSL